MMNLMEQLQGPSTDPQWWESIVRLLLALLIGGALGWEREISNRPAGLRTYILVTVGAATFTLVAIGFLNVAREQDLDGLDPMKLLGGVVGGIGFLGAGTIIEAGGRVRGLTTAAGLWLTASLGIAIASGMYVLAVTAMLLGLATLRLVRRLERRREGDEDEARR